MSEFFAAILKIFFAAGFDALDKALTRPQTAITAEKPPEQDAVMQSIREAQERGEVM